MPPGSATVQAIDYNLKRWAELTRFVGDSDVPISTNWVEDQIRPIAIERSNWLFAGNLRAGQRAVVAMSLLQSARINGHDPYAYFKNVLERLPTHSASRTAGSPLPEERLQPGARRQGWDNRTLTVVLCGSKVQHRCCRRCPTDPKGRDCFGPLASGD